MEKQEFFNELYRKYEKDVYKVIYCYIQNPDICYDCVQKTFLKTWNKINYVMTLEEEHQKNFICKIARDTAFSKLRKSKY